MRRKEPHVGQPHLETCSVIEAAMPRLRPLIFHVIVVWAVAVLSPQANATLTLFYPNNTSVEFPCWAIKYQGNSMDFAPFNGTLRPESAAVVGDIISYTYRGMEQPLTEVVLTYFKSRFNPQAVVVFHQEGDGSGPYYFVNHEQAGDVMQSAEYEFGLDSAAVTFPVVSVDFHEGEIIKQALLEFGALQVRITSEADYYNTRFKNSGFYHAFSVILVVWSSTNVVIAGYKLWTVGLSRNLASVCLSLEIIAHTIRILFGLDPFAPWVLFPWPFLRVILTTSLPITLASMLLFTFYWQELVSGTLELSPFLTRSKIPAAVVITVLLVLETISSSMRAVEFDWNTLTTVTAIIYTVVVLGMLIHFIYVSTKVLMFIHELPRQGSRAKLLRLVTIRSAVATCGMLLFLSSSALALTAFFETTEGSATFAFLLLNGCNFVGTMLILAFQAPSSSNTLSGSRRSTFGSKDRTSSA